MLEIPESNVIAKQLNDCIKGKVIRLVKANQSPHAFAWYQGNPDDYDELLEAKEIGEATAYGGMVEIEAEDCGIVVGDGATLRFYDNLAKVPKKHQLYIEFDDDTALVGTIQMYGGMWAFRKGEFDNSYFQLAMDKPSPLSDQFDYEYFTSLRNEKASKLSAKAFLATEQRIPGLGNGVLQDILFKSGIHPKRKMIDVTEDEYRLLYDTIKNILLEMYQNGGRDTEKDLYGEKGKYITYLSRNTYLTPCPICGYEIRKANYMGGTIYFCENCQR
ncbi:MAG TPA: endonuclease VIII [Lachnospiraceae bacterium]|nr:endonuclease VIII [Lachnospiraceae bacterium]